MRRMFSKKQIEELVQGIADDYELKEDLSDDVLDVVDGAESGTIANVLGLDSDGGLVKNSSIDIDSVKADEIIENMSGYSASLTTPPQVSAVITNIYTGIVKNGNKLTFVVFLIINKTNNDVPAGIIENFVIPSDVGSKLYPSGLGMENLWIDFKIINAFDTLTSATPLQARLRKNSNTSLDLVIGGLDGLTANKDYFVRYEATFLLSDNLLGA